MFQSVTLYAATLGNDEYHKGLNRCLSPQQADCRRGIVVSIGCIHANFRSRLMHDLNNIRVTARGQQRKKVKGHYMLPIDERIGAKKRFVKRGIETEKRKGRRKQRRVRKLSLILLTIRFSMKLDRPRVTFSFPLFRVSVTNTRGMQPRERRPVDVIKKKRLCTRSLFFIIHIHKVGNDVFRYTCMYTSVSFFLFC